MNFSSDAMADFEGLLEVNRKICQQQMAEKASPTLPTNCAVLPLLFVRYWPAFPRFSFCPAWMPFVIILSHRRFPPLHTSGISPARCPIAIHVSRRYEAFGAIANQILSIAQSKRLTHNWLILRAAVLQQRTLHSLFLRRTRYEYRLHRPRIKTCENMQVLNVPGVG